MKKENYYTQHLGIETIVAPFEMGGGGGSTAASSISSAGLGGLGVYGGIGSIGSGETIYPFTATPIGSALGGLKASSIAPNANIVAGALSAAPADCA